MSLFEFRSKLINQILFAASQEEVKCFTDNALKTLQQNDINGHIITRFVDKSIHELEQFNPINKDSQQWSNIKMARICLNRIKLRLTTTGN